MTRLARTILISLTAMLTIASGARAQVLSDKLPAQIDGLEVADKRGNAIPADIQLYNAQGEQVYIGDYFNTERPTLFMLVYYNCPKLCEVMLNHMNKVVNDVTFDVGEDYQIIVVSFDHTNTTSMAAGKQEFLQGSYKRGLSEDGKDHYLFHTTTANDARRLAEAVGFDYRYIPQAKEFSHPSVMYVLTPDGRVSNYLSGIGYESRQLRIALLEASDGKIAQSLTDFFLHYCFVYDPNAGAFSAEAMQIMKVGGVLSIICVGTLLVVLRIKESVRRKLHRTSQHMSTSTGSRPMPKSKAMPGISGVGS